jgi:DNA-binding transcriptional LysR family regulator
LVVPQGDKAVTIPLESKLSISVNEGAIVAAVAGLGIISTGTPAQMPELARGALVRLLPDWEMDRGDVHAVYAHGRMAKPAARIFTDFLVSEYRGG